MSEELKCPFCGGELRIVYHSDENSLLQCQACWKAIAESTLRIMRLKECVAKLEAERDRLKKSNAELGKKLGVMISFCGNLPEHLVTGEALEIFNEVYGG